MTLLLNRWVQLAVAFGLAAFFCWRWTAALEAVGSVKAGLNVAVAANGTNQATITELEGRIRQIVVERAMDAQEREDALAKRDRELAAAQRAADRARRERDALFRSTPGCDQLGRIDIAVACPSVGRRLQERSRGDGDENGDGPG